MKYIHYKKQTGFSILAVILVIVAVVVAIGIWSLSGQNNTNNNNNMDLAIEGLLNDSLAIKSKVDSLVLEKGPNYNMRDSGFTYDKPAISRLLIKNNATSSEGKWIVNPSNFYAFNIGYNANSDATLLIGGINDIACKKINYKIYGSTTVPVISSPSSSNAVVDPITDYFAINYVYLPSYAGLNGWNKGCFNAGGAVDNNVFFLVLHAR